MEWDVVEVAACSDMSLQVRFADGMQGRVIFEQSHLFGVFESLKDPDFFCRAYLDYGVVTWPGSIDIAPDAMYREIKQHGQWVLR
ncbi:MAG: hypothetical protein A2342_09870 [Gallionellales bacterium RIFOXYB12_FULL_54_9]|nr:MAG: hypothetical protein A2342_09870 [Gallionellales bacterium RIFOXYB12_FULL_54_9]